MEDNPNPNQGSEPEAPEPAPLQIGAATRACLICLGPFTPSKYRPAQQVCSKPECQKERQRRNIRIWNERNPAYFRHIHANPYWREKRSERSRQWRLAHPERIREYRMLHREHYRLYMREYMRQYRKRRQQEVA